MTTILHNARVFQTVGLKNPEHHFVNSLAIDNATGRITYVGSIDDPIIASLKESATHHDMKGRVVLPSFMDGHMHLLVLGQSLRKVVLSHCQTLEDVRASIREYAAAHPDNERILCCGWMPHMTDGKATAEMLDDLDPRPIFIDSKDQHSTWCNTAALKELGVEYDYPDPPGGTIHRDENGGATGLLSEGCAFFLVWPHLARVGSTSYNTELIKAAMATYIAQGYTGLVEMAMSENTWEALLALRDSEGLPMRVAGYWLVRPGDTEAETLENVERVVELSRRYNAETSPDCRIVGIKIICDGTIDACTAALTEPYSDGTTYDLLWPMELLKPVVEKAIGAGLQCALHAIGDAAIKNAIDVLELYGSAEQRHRIEHLELSSPEDAKRLGKLGITASIQPVHSDPAILTQWERILGKHRCGRAFAYTDYAEGGAVLAIGSDAPTANHDPLKNLYTATTRRSAINPGLGEVTVNANYALELAAAMVAATEGSAYSCFADRWTGRIEAGKSADLAVLDMEWNGEKLLEAKVVQTWFKGKKVFDSETR
ncbi:related to metal-dependent hydrolase with the TIM-barrel fold [Cephalotrichum gorgonifer]|uniref:Related to metal-dependent hydrolase with the TIM-barrel fold n=1 Tax=Cephalotrichum gorgonifer TaxID=2041049 RepID=A0AAE8MZS0_9PEZI|nr:related to metal-dependent hydrolase with the TIM-barrel fold [Cephalotrichum gorgonifer]